MKDLNGKISVIIPAYNEAKHIGVAFNPEFLYRKLMYIKDLDDIKYFFRAGKRVIGHLFDFSPVKNK